MPGTRLSDSDKLTRALPSRTTRASTLSIATGRSNSRASSRVALTTTSGNSARPELSTACAAPSSGIAIASTIHEVVVARIDRLLGPKPRYRQLRDPSGHGAPAGLRLPLGGTRRL